MGGAKFNKGAKCNKDHNTGIRNGSQGLHSYVQEMGSVIKRHFCRKNSFLSRIGTLIVFQYSVATLFNTIIFVTLNHIEYGL